jgi:hypothetical protein
MWREMLSLAQPGDFVYFSTYALVRIVPPFSSFFLVPLEHYELQLQHYRCSFMTLSLAPLLKQPAEVH